MAGGRLPRTPAKPTPETPGAASRTPSPPQARTPSPPNPRTSSSPQARRPAVPALRRGLQVLHVLASRPEPVPAATLARALDLPRSTVYELLTELADAGFAVHLPVSRRWGLGPTAFEIGSAYLRGQPLERLAGPVLARLAGTTSGVAHLGVLHGSQTLYLAKERPLHGPALVTEVGVRLPASLTATGLAILAALPAAQVRALFPSPATFVIRTDRGSRSLPELRVRLRTIRGRGWAVEDGEVSPDTASLAAPVFDHNGMPLAAIGVTVAHRCPPGTDSRYGCGTDLAELSTLVRSATASLTAAVGGRPPRTPDMQVRR